MNANGEMRVTQYDLVARADVKTLAGHARNVIHGTAVAGSKIRQGQVFGVVVDPGVFPTDGRTVDFPAL